MKNLSLIASALAMLGLTACEKGLVDGVADVAPAGQAAKSVLFLTNLVVGSTTFLPFNMQFVDMKRIVNTLIVASIKII